MSNRIQDVIESKAIRDICDIWKRFSHFELPSLSRTELATFDNLEQDRNKGAQARKRRFSQYQVYFEDGWNLYRLKHRPFVQSISHNTLVGGVLRHFEPLELDPTSLVAAAAEAAGLDSSVVWQSNVHQIRVSAVRGGKTKIVPEGLHRDGHELAALLIVTRENIRDGVTKLVTDVNEAPVYEGILESGKGIIFDDTSFLHDTTPIVATQGVGRRDMFIIVFNQWNKAKYGPEHEEHSKRMRPRQRVI